MELRCPGEVFETLVAQKFKIDIDEALVRKHNYVKFQTKINDDFSKELRRKEVLPPCCKCNPVTFCYCDETGTECKTFIKYTGGSKF